VLPLAEPGAIGRALKSMLTPNAPFRIRPRLDTALWRWLWSFARRCNDEDRIAAGRAIHPLLLSSFKLYEELIERERLDCEWQKRGLLFAYENAAAFDSFSRVNDLLAAEFNEPARRMDGEELSGFEPALKQGLAGAWYYEHDAHLRPERLLASWRALLEGRGVRFVENRELRAWEECDGRVGAALVSGERIEAEAFVVATGAWTPRIARILRCRIPIQPGKGYSVIVPRPKNCPAAPLIFPERRVAVTPFEGGLRIGSIMEFAGYDERIRPQRIRLLTSAAEHFLSETISSDLSQQWYGWRPMTYDSTPIIGRVPSFGNVFLAAGHNMLGLSMATATGRLIQELVMGQPPHLPIRPYAVERLIG
jgi:D-amino-acid dehydrogenase